MQKLSEYGLEKTQSDTADQPTAPWGRTTEHEHKQDIRKTINANNNLALMLDFILMWSKIVFKIAFWTRKRQDLATSSRDIVINVTALYPYFIHRVLMYYRFFQMC